MTSHTTVSSQVHHIRYSQSLSSSAAYSTYCGGCPPNTTAAICTYFARAAAQLRLPHGGQMGREALRQRLGQRQRARQCGGQAPGALRRTAFRRAVSLGGPRGVGAQRRVRFACEFAADGGDVRVPFGRDKGEGGLHDIGGLHGRLHHHGHEGRCMARYRPASSGTNRREGAGGWLTADQTHPGLQPSTGHLPGAPHLFPAVLYRPQHIPATTAPPAVQYGRMEHRLCSSAQMGGLEVPAQCGVPITV